MWRYARHALWRLLFEKLWGEAHRSGRAAFQILSPFWTTASDFYYTPSTTLSHVCTYTCETYSTQNQKSIVHLHTEDHMGDESDGALGYYVLRVCDLGLG